MALIDDWQAFVRGEARFDRSHFADLFKNYPDESYVRNALAMVVHGGDVGDRIIKVISENIRVGFEYLIPSPENYLPRSDIEALAARSVAEIKAFLLEVGAKSLARQIDERQMVYNDDFIQTENMLSDVNLPMCEIEDFISDRFNKKIADLDIRYIRGLREAVIYLSLVPNVTRFVLDPIVNLGMDCARHYELWKAGGVCVITEKEIVYSVRQF